MAAGGRGGQSTNLASSLAVLCAYDRISENRPVRREPNPLSRFVDGSLCSTNVSLMTVFWALRVIVIVFGGLGGAVVADLLLPENLALRLIVIPSSVLAGAIFLTKAYLALLDFLAIVESARAAKMKARSGR